MSLRLDVSDGRTWPMDVKEQPEGVWDVTCDFGGLLVNDTEACLTLELPSAATGNRVLWPLDVGVLEQEELNREGLAEPSKYVFRSAGRPVGECARSQRLALPMCLIETDNGYYLVGSDAAFSATMEIKANAQGDARKVTWQWWWLAEAGRHGREKRQIFCVPVKSIEDGLKTWHRLATPTTSDTQWLQEIAWNHYDYFGKNGEAWFADLDAIAAIVPPVQRHRVIACIHGWYGMIGDFGYDRSTKRMKKEWSVFPFAGDERVLALGRKSTKRVVGGIPSPANYIFGDTTEIRSVPMSVPELRRRLAYAKSLGFRSAVYHLTGMQTFGDSKEAIEQGRGLETPYGRWLGPDQVGESYFMNPLHPEVRDFLLNYTRALLDAVCDLTDALVMDESYYTCRGQLGPAACRGYADRAQMTLIREITELCHAYRPDLAYLTADLIGHPTMIDRVFPYCLFADGLWQDAWWWPQVWDSVRFATWTKPALNCMWAPISNQEFVKWGVVRYGSALPTSNGCFGDGIGPADYDEDALCMLRELWAMASGRRRDREITTIKSNPRSKDKDI